MKYLLVKVAVKSFKFWKDKSSLGKAIRSKPGKAFKSILCQENIKTYVHPVCINFYSGTPIS